MTIRTVSRVTAITLTTIAVLAGAACASQVGGSAAGASNQGAQAPSVISQSGSSDTSVVDPAQVSDQNTQASSTASPTSDIFGDGSAAAPGTTEASDTNTPATTTEQTSTAEQTSTTGSTIGTSSAAVPATTANPANYPGTVTQVGFSSPTKNIDCGFIDDGVVCQIHTFTYRAQPSGDCHGGGQWGAAVQLTSVDGVGFFCAGDVEGGGKVLPYGSSLTVGKTTCTSAETGVSCSVAGGERFRLAAASYTFSTSGAGDAGFSTPKALVGEWMGHGRGMTISAAGAGSLDYRVYSFCSDNPKPPCDQTKGNAIIDGGHVTFALTASDSATTAKGTVTTSADPQYAVGSPVIVTRNGYHVMLSIWPDVPFCASNTPEGKWDCGA